VLWNSSSCINPSFPPGALFTPAPCLDALRHCTGHVFIIHNLGPKIMRRIKVRFLFAFSQAREQEALRNKQLRRLLAPASPVVLLTSLFYFLITAPAFSRPQVTSKKRPRRHKKKNLVCPFTGQRARGPERQASASPPRPRLARSPPERRLGNAPPAAPVRLWVRHCGLLSDGGDWRDPGRPATWSGAGARASSAETGGYLSFSGCSQTGREMVRSVTTFC
jgi:hypothetical protein